MKKRTAFLFIVLILMSILLSSCHRVPQKEPDLPQKLTQGIATLLDTEYLNIDSRISIDGVATESVVGCVDNNMSQAKVSIGDTAYYYFASTRFQGDDEKVTIVDNISFDALVNLMGTTLLNFRFDSDNFSSINQYDNTIIAQFVGKGATYSFGTAIELSGGSFSVFFDDDSITKTVFSSTYKENSQTHIYTAVTTYSVGTKLWDSTPKVMPSNSPKYARYILEKLSSSHPSKTFRLESTEHNTSFKVGGIIREERLMGKVFTTSSESGLHTLTVVYTSPQLFIGLAGNIQSFDLFYDDDNNIEYMYINDNEQSKYLFS